MSKRVDLWLQRYFPFLSAHAILRAGQTPLFALGQLRQLVAVPAGGGVSNDAGGRWFEWMQFMVKLTEGYLA